MSEYQIWVNIHHASNPEDLMKQLEEEEDDNLLSEPEIVEGVDKNAFAALKGVMKSNPRVIIK